MATTPARTLRVLFVDTVPRLSGAEQSLADMAERLHEVGIEPVVVLPSEGPLTQRLRAHGVLVRTIKIDEDLLTVSRSSLAGKPWIALLRLFSLLAAGRRLRKLIKELDPLVVHSNTLKAHLLCVLPCLRTRTPLVWHLRDILPRNWVSAAFIWIARAVSVIIVPSRAVAEPLRLSKKVYRKVRLVPNGIRVQDFIDAREDRSLREVVGAKRKDPVIGLVGRIAPWKGQEVFVRAAAMLATRHPNARFALFGGVLFPENDAPFDAYLKRLVMDLRLSDQVAFLGHQPAPEAMAACDIVVHCSLEPEPFGRVIAEAMAAGKPVIAAAGGATAEILPPAAGFIVPPGRPDLLADAIDRLISDPELREHMGETGEDVASSFFDLERVVHSVAQIHRALAARTARRRRNVRRRAVRTIAQKVPKPQRVKKVRSQQSVQLPKHGWHRDARGVWVPPVGTDPWAGGAEPLTGADTPLDGFAGYGDAPAYGSEDFEQAADESHYEDDEHVEDQYEDDYEASEDDYDDDVDDDDLDDGYEAEADDYEYESEEDLEYEDEDDFEDEEEDEGTPPGAFRADVRPQNPPAIPPPPPVGVAVAPSTPAVPPVGSDPAPAPRGVSILDLTAEEQRAPRKPAPASVAGGQAGVVARVASAPVATHSAPAYAVGYPAAPEVKSAHAFPLAKPHIGYAFLKRTMDLAVSILVLVIGAPVWLGIALAIKLGSPGPVLHRGTVHGVGGKPFTYYKFRTMRLGTSDHEHRRFIERYVLENGGHLDGGEVVYKLTSDDRVTSIGRFLRRLSLDEIPQLINVIKGQMSLVGPRPPLDYEFELYDERAMLRLTVRPGITGLQQVWARNMASFEDKLRMDLNYIRERTIWMDIKLLIHTIPSAVRGH